MDNLSDVCSCLRALDSSKATDRKKNATRLQQLLDTDSVKRVLDNNSSNTDEQRAITWDVILRGVNKYVNIELSSLKTAKESQSATTLSNREKRKHELADLFKFVVRAANEREARLSSSQLLDSILEVLQDEFTLGALGADYSNILLKSVLRVRTYRLKLTPTQWRKLLHIYCKLFEEEAFDRTIVVSIIKELVAGNIQQGELNPKRLFSFFSRVMEHISNLRAPYVLENLLMALNSFCQSVALSCRVQICGFGESQMGVFTSLWEKASTEKIKEELIVFFHLLVRAHHPCGVSQPGEGAFAVDWNLWQSQLLILHELIVSDINLSAGSYKIISGSKDNGLKPAYVSLSADIFKQLPSTKIVPASPDWSLTQATQLTGQVREGNGIFGDGGTPAKRLRLTPEKKALLELVRESCGTLQAIPWLQILHRLLERYSQVFDKDGLHLTLELLVNMLGRCKRGHMYQHLFAALSALISALHQHDIDSQRQAQLMAALWSHCLSTINSRQAGVEGYQEQGFSAMACIIHCGYILPRPEIWNLFLPGLCRPCPASNSLLTALICQGLPENHVPSIVGTSTSSSDLSGHSSRSESSQNRPVYPLRRCLMRWLLPFHDADNAAAGGSASPGDGLRGTDLSPQKVAELLYALTLQNLTAVLRQAHHSVPSKSGTPSHHSFEFMYLNNLFEASDLSQNISAISVATGSEGASGKESFHHGSHIPSVLDYLRKLLLKVSRNIESLEPGVQSLEFISWFSCMLTKLYCLLLSCSGNNGREPTGDSSGSTNTNTLHLSSFSAVEKILCAVTEKCATSFVTYVKKEGYAGLQPMLGYLCSILDWEQRLVELSSQDAMFLAAQVVRSALPADFVDLLVDIVSGKVMRAEIKRSKGRHNMDRTQSNNSELRSASHRSEDLDLDMFELFDGNFNRNREACRRVSDNEEDMDLGINLGSSSFSSLKSNKDFLSEDLLTEAQHIQLESSHLLATLISFDWREARETDVSIGSLGVGIDSDYIKSKMLQRLSIDNFDPASPLDVHILLTLIKHLLTNSHHVTDTDVKALLRSVKQAAKEHQKDQQVCCKLVETLCFMVPHLKGPHDDQGDTSPSEELKLCRDFFFKIVSSFWQLACDGTPPLKMKMAELLLDLIKFDPGCTWGQLTVECNDDTDRDGTDSPGFSLCSVRQQFPRILLETSLGVRAFVAHSLKWLFACSRNSRTLNKKTQTKIFDEVFMLSSELLNVERGSTHHLRDELSNGQSIFLHVLLTIIKCSPVCEKQCLLGLFQMMADKDISPQLVSKMLGQACTHLGYSGVEKFLASHLPYLVYNWLHDDMVSSPLEKFPFQLLGYTDVDSFTRAYPNLIVSMLLATKMDMGQVQVRLTQAGLDVRSTLLNALPDVLVHVLPQFAIKSALDRPSSQAGGVTASQQVLHKQFQIANKCFTALKQGLSEQEINEKVCEMLGVIVVKVLSCLHVKCHTSDVSDILVYPEPNPPYYNEDKIILTLDYLAQNFNDDNGGDKFSLASVLAKVPNGLHQVFLSLSSLLWRAHHAYEQSRCLQMMGIFIRLVLREMRPSGSGRSPRIPADAAVSVIIRDILNRLLVILRSRVGFDNKANVASPSYEEDVILSCLKILHDVCHSVLANCPQELVHFLLCIVDAVAIAAGLSQAAGQSALQILHTLTGQGQQGESSCPQELKEALSLLNPLPPVPVLAELRTSLARRYSNRNSSMSQMLDDFLAVCDMTCSFPSRGLALRMEDLFSCIIMNHQEIKSMVNTVKGLNQLQDAMQRLSDLSTSSCQAVASAAASCLGAIGPFHLQVLSLRSYQSGKRSLVIEEYKGQEFENYCWLFQALDDCLLDESLEVVGTASTVLQKVMATESSKQFEKHYIKVTKGQSSLFHYLQPFKNSPQDLLDPDPVPSQAFSSMDRTELWLGEQDDPASEIKQTHETWVKALVSELLSTGIVKDEVMCKIGPLCALKVDFCESSLPYLIHEALIGDMKECREILSRQFSAFFHCHEIQEKTSQQVPSEHYPLVMNKKSIRTMLSVVQYLRTQKRPLQSSGEVHTAWHNNLWLDLNYLEVARAAQFCGASFSAVLFTEIHLGTKRQAAETRHSQQDSVGSGSRSQGQGRMPNLAEETRECQALMMEAYKTIGDPDGIYGCGAGKQTDILTRVETYMHEMQQVKALTTLDIAMSTEPRLTEAHLLQVLQSCGADYVLRQCLPKMQSQIGNSRQLSTASLQMQKGGEKLDEFQYQMAWKLGQWDLCVPHRQTSQSPFHESVYSCLSSLKDGHLDVARASLQAARLNAVQGFDLKVETCMHLYPFLSQLQCLGYLDQVLENLQQHTRDSSSIIEVPEPALCQMVKFPFQEALLQLMSAAGRTLESRGIRQGEAMEVKALWNLAVGGRKAKYFQVAEKAIQTLRLKLNTRGISRDLGITQHQLQLEEAKFFWARSEVDMAKSILHGLLQSCSQHSSSSQQIWNTDSNTYIQSLVLYGSWLAETKSETPSAIIDYFQKAVTLMRNEDSDSISDKTALQAFVSLASFADEQYQVIVDYMRSPVYEEKCRLVRQSKSEVEEYMKMDVKNRITMQTIRKNVEIDEREVATLQEDRERFLIQALDSYLQCLRRGDLHDLRISRVLALWFDNSSHKQINKMMASYVPKLQSHKFLLLFYQLATRMGVQHGDNGFNSTLKQLLERVAIDHPHHALWVLLALAHAHKDSEFTAKGDGEQKRRGRRDSSEDQAVEEERVQAAKDLLERVGRAKSGRAGVHLDQIVDGMRRFSLACIQLANLPVDKKAASQSQSHSLTQSLAITKLQNLENVQIPIVELAVDSTGSYTNLVSLVKFDRCFRTAGGVNLPKIISCIGSDGVKRTTLVKGRDDLRQDAVMQQVFSLVNQLLATDQETRLRQLSIRTYKVIPLSQNSGLLQWCDGTMPLGDYLAARQGDAHSRYNPHDWKVMDCRRHLHDARFDKDKLLKAYQEICDHFHPVFRHFFLERFVEPSHWFERRLAYTRSVATNSIVGYILGLGDRHVNNILIDLQTAELVHIDFGIAFERGRILPTPETVPFRLTRDIVDGMGISGVEGVFRRCCEKMMQVMKNNSEALLTIVQVLLHDPLSHWSLTQSEILALQRKREQAAMDTVDMTLSGQVPSSGVVTQSGQVPASGGDTNSGNGNETKEKRNKLAERTLLRLRQKLSGEEDIVPLSVSGQVNLLIQKATDPQNLSRLFVGWQPYL